jgi:phosphoribosylformylglycinamidine cyclo-ligase
MTEKFTYKDAGVDIELSDRVIGSLSERIKATFRPDVIGGMGGFAAMVNPDWSRYENPVMVSATDGVGTKLKLAFLTGIHDTVGIDLVAMSVNDILVTGAEPIFFLDYFATGAIEAETVSSVISGIARGCEMAGCSLIGGETAEMPDFYAAGEYDLAGFCVGIVDKKRVIDGSAIKPGDVALGLASSGAHSNGFSLIRKVLLDRKGYSLDSTPHGLEKPLGEELLTPTQIYVKPVLDLLHTIPIAGIVHITGGGFYGNIPRVLPESCSMVIRKKTWEVPPVFDLIRAEAALDDDEMFRTFNMGIGLMLVVSETDADQAVSLLNKKGIKTWVIGHIIERRPDDEPVHLE